MKLQEAKVISKSRSSLGDIDLQSKSPAQDILNNGSNHTASSCNSKPS